MPLRVVDKHPKSTKSRGLTAGYPQVQIMPLQIEFGQSIGGLWVSKYLGLVLALSLLSGCASSPGEIQPEVTASPSPTLELSIFDAGCAKLADGTLNHSHLEVYRLILEDICKDFEMDYALVDVSYSPKVRRGGAERYVDSNVFGLSYWNKYVEGGLAPLKIILVSEEEQSWWADQLEGQLTLEPEWFGPSDGGGHCYAAEAEAFCNKAYYGMDKEVEGDSNILTTMVGSRMEWTTFRRVVPIHEATHQFHSATGLGNWRYWYIEGQATYFEMASSVLVSGLGGSNWRAEQAELAGTQDRIRFNATTAKEAYEFMKKCETGTGCQGFSYFGSSLAHELLVNTYGVEKYFAWNLALADRLPDFLWRETPSNQAVMQRGLQGFAKIFKEFFDVDIDEWERKEFAPYLLQTYQCEVVKKKCS
jgi:hypothetical protein